MAYAQDATRQRPTPLHSAWPPILVFAWGLTSLGTRSPIMTVSTLPLDSCRRLLYGTIGVPYELHSPCHCHCRHGVILSSACPMCPYTYSSVNTTMSFATIRSQPSSVAGVPPSWTIVIVADDTPTVPPSHLALLRFFKYSDFQPLRRLTLSSPPPSCTAILLGRFGPK